MKFSNVLLGMNPACESRCHILPNIQIHFVVNQFQYSPFFYQGIETLRYILTSHETDSRFQHQEKKERICSLYFPYVIIVVDGLPVIKSMRVYERRLWLICFMYILKGTNSRLLRDWLKKEAQKRQLGFFETLTLVVDTFEVLELCDLFTDILVVPWSW